MNIGELVKRLRNPVRFGNESQEQAKQRHFMDRQEAAAALESLQRELEEARKHLAYAIEEADGWCDESRGCDVRGPEMDAARAFLAARQQQGG
jgi:hypothetical protein